MYVAGSSSKKGSGVGIVLEGLGDAKIIQSLILKFKTSKNQVGYEALIARLVLVDDVDVKKLSCKTDSQVMVGEIHRIPSQGSPTQVLQHGKTKNEVF